MDDWMDGWRTLMAIQYDAAFLFFFSPLPYSTSSSEQRPTPDVPDLAPSPPFHHNNKNSSALFSQPWQTTTRPAQVTLSPSRVPCWERIQTRCSETRIQSSACEMSSSAVIPDTSSAYSHIRRSELGFPACAR